MITQEDLDRFMAPRKGATTPDLVIPAPVQATQVDTPAFAQERDNAQELFQREQELEETPLSTALTSSVKDWDTARLWDAAFNKPQFAENPQFAPEESLQHVDIPITTDDREFLFKSKSQDEFNWRVEQLKGMRQRTELAQTAPLMNAAVQFADPIYLAADLLSAGAASALKAGRVATAVAGAATTASLMHTVGNEARPVSQNEIIMGAALHGAASMVFFRPGRQVEDVANMTPEEFARRNGVDPDNPPAFDPTMMGSPLAMAGNIRPSARPTVDEVPEAIRNAAQRGLDQARRGVQTNPKRPTLEWSLYKNFTQFGEEGKAVADRLLDDPLNPSVGSAASVQRELHSRFSMLLNQYEDTIRHSLREGGWSNAKRLRSPEGYQRAQQEFEQAVRAELDYRMVDPQFRGSNARVAQAADRLGEYSRSVGKELESRGMVEPGFTEKNPYYYPRRMNVTQVERVEGLVGKRAFMDAMTTAVQRGIKADRSTSNAIAYAMVERARRKGYGIDNSGHIVNNEGKQELLDIINAAPGIDDAAKARASALLQPSAEDAARAPMLKGRINVDMLHQIAPGVQVRDLFDDSIASMMDAYNRRITGRMALHQVGLGDDAAIAEVRTNLAKSIKDSTQRRAALKQFDDIINYYRGNPVGEELNQGMRNLAALTQAAGLASSGLWQLVEYGTLMQRHGAYNTFKTMLRTIPEARALFRQMRVTTQEGKQLALDTEEALTASIASDVRMRPILSHYEDMFTADKSPWVLRAEHARDATMYLNLQKYIHFHQTRTNAALVMQTLRKASEGDAKAIAAMRTYGADDALLADIRKEVAKHGTKPDAWDEQVFNRARVALVNAMDDGIVRARLGEIPAFAEFSTLGKFLFTFRRFVAAAHNKTVLGTLHREGARGLATLMAYQYPLAMLATAANNIITGKAIQDPQVMQPSRIAAASINYMSAIGFASEFLGVLTGQQRSFGTPGLLFLDKAYGIMGNVSAVGAGAVTGDMEQVGANAQAAVGNTLLALPILSVTPGYRALVQSLKEYDGDED